MATIPSNAHTCTPERYQHFLVVPALVLAIAWSFVYCDARSSPTLLAVTFGTWICLHVCSLVILQHRHIPEPRKIPRDGGWFNLGHIDAHTRLQTCALPSWISLGVMGAYSACLLGLGAYTMHVRPPIGNVYPLPWYTIVPAGVSILVFLQNIHTMIWDSKGFDPTEAIWNLEG